MYTVQGCEREVAEAEKGSSDELKSECIMRLSWALVHSKRPEDVQRGIAMLEGEIFNPLALESMPPFHSRLWHVLAFHAPWNPCFGL